MQESRIKKSDSPLIDTYLFHTERADETDFHRSFFYSTREKEEGMDSTGFEEQERFTTEDTEMRYRIFIRCFKLNEHNNFLIFSYK